MGFICDSAAQFVGIDGVEPPDLLLEDGRKVVLAEGHSLPLSSDNPSGKHDETHYESSDGNNNKPTISSTTSYSAFHPA